ncbi:MAG TPA: nuclease [Gammaproteobacteria bacterium]|nr:nuclease [Gammaproteobacteria bacterium]
MTTALTIRLVPNVIRRTTHAISSGLLGQTLAFFLLIPLIASAETTVEARIVGITDGDTVKALIGEKQQWKVRLAEIDAPEKRQPWSKRAKQALASKIFGKNVRIIVSGKDRYGRYIGKIYLGSRDINREMVREGHAWVYRKYMKDRSLLTEEQAARSNESGLWSLPKDSLTPPWKWRSTGHHHNSRGASKPIIAPSQLDACSNEL